MRQQLKVHTGQYNATVLPLKTQPVLHWIIVMLRHRQCYLALEVAMLVIDSMKLYRISAYTSTFDVHIVHENLIETQGIH